jgi:hypothetical protein
MTPRTLAVTVLAGVLLAGPAQAASFTTTHNEIESTFTLEFIGLPSLPSYTQIRLDGVEGLVWQTTDPALLPSTEFNGTGFTVSPNGIDPDAENLEMQYEGAPPPPANSITYHYFADSYDFVGYEDVEWVMVSGDTEFSLTGPKPLLLPEPSTGSLCLLALATACMLRRSLNG